MIYIRFLAARAAMHRRAHPPPLSLSLPLKITFGYRRSAAAATAAAVATLTRRYYVRLSAARQNAGERDFSRHGPGATHPLIPRRVCCSKRRLFN